MAFDGAALSYRALNEQGNRLAHALRRLGVGPDVPVGVCLQRSPALIVALRAILKAGGAYIALDAAYPRERLSFLVEDAGAPVIVTEEARLPALPPSP